MRGRRSSLDGTDLGFKFGIFLAVLLVAGLIGLVIYGAGVEPTTRSYELNLPDASFPQ